MKKPLITRILTAAGRSGKARPAISRKEMFKIIDKRYSRAIERLSDT